MRYGWLILLLVSGVAATAQPPRIHAHNDYQKTEPLTNALRNRAFSLEADVFLVNDTLRVAHDANELDKAPSLRDLYLRPIIAMLKTHQGHISADTGYGLVLVIDIKQNGAAVLAKLVKELSAYRAVFNRNAFQFVISGDRGPVEKWKDCPEFILFDGRPNENYDSLTLQKIGFISDSYFNYVIPKDSIQTRIRNLANKVHDMGKWLRLWAAPDNPGGWELQQKLGVDIINTDKVEECRRFFLK